MWARFQKTKKDGEWYLRNGELQRIKSADERDLMVGIDQITKSAEDGR